MAGRTVSRWAMMAALGLALASPGLAQDAPGADLGAYLAARAAVSAADFAAAAPLITRALAANPDDVQLLENLIATHIALGDFAAALPAAQHMLDLGQPSQLAAVVHAVAAVRAGDWRGLFADLESGRSVGPVADALGRAWAHVGEGEMTVALSAFDEVIAARGLLPYGLYHKALALALVGDFEGAEAILSLPPDQGMQQTRRAVIARAQILSQLGRGADALAAIDAAFPGTTDPAIAALRARLADGQTLPFSLIDSPAGGLAEAYYGLAATLRDQVDDSTVLFFARTTQALDPGHVDAILLAGQTLDRMGQYDLANATYAQVPPDDPAYVMAELGRAESLRRAGAAETAVEVLTALTRSHPDLAQVQATLGDSLRMLRRDADANAAYTRALDLAAPDDPVRWYLHYVRGITHHRLDDWPGAEADFRAALALNPGRPAVLNYLGYSLVERREKLDEALAMIEQAVAVEPQNGAIVDSLGWALFTLGRAAEAVPHMEQAAALLPTDAVVNDHLGDVYWTVGRQREAQFQWRRALSFSDDPALSDRINRKLDIGLDAVLEQEGAAPPAVVGQDG